MLPARGTVEYNGYPFNATAQTRVTAVPIKDRAGRTVTHVEYTLRVTWFLYNLESGLSCADQLTLARQKLEVARKRLRYLGNGFGDLDVNGADPKKIDLKWGPTPSEVSYRVVGHGQVWECSWSCVFNISECSTLSLNALSILGFGYGLNWTFDEQGLCTRTYSGYLQIPGYANAAGTWNNADDLRELIQVPIPPGFRRTGRDFKLSEDRSTLEFTITDVEIPAESIPLGCVEADGSHDISNMNPRDLANWQGRIAASYTVSPDRPREVAWDAFWALAVDRINQTIDANKRRGKPGNQPLLTSFRASEGLYGNNRRMTFELTYMFTADLRNVFADAGLWRPVPNTENTLWATSVGNIVGNRGLSNLRFNPAEDVIINLCETNIPRMPGGIGSGSAMRGERDVEPPRLKAEGYLSFQNSVEFETEHGYIWNRLLTESDARHSLTTRAERDTNPTQVTGGGTGAGGDFGTSNNPPPGASGTGIPYVPPLPTSQSTQSAQARGTPLRQAKMRGYAVRAGRPAPPPQMQQVGRSPAVPYGEDHFKQRCLGSVMGVPIFVSEWIQSYAVPEVPGAISTDAIPLYGPEGQAPSPPPAQFVTFGPMGVPNLPNVFRLPFDQ